MIKAVTTMDRFGVPVTINYKGKDRHKSCLGGFLTIVVYSFLFSIFMFMFVFFDYS